MIISELTYFVACEAHTLVHALFDMRFLPSHRFARSPAGRAAANPGDARQGRSSSQGENTFVFAALQNC